MKNDLDLWTWVSHKDAWFERCQDCSKWTQKTAPDMSKRPVPEKHEHEILEQTIRRERSGADRSGCGPGLARNVMCSKRRDPPTRWQDTAGGYSRQQLYWLYQTFGGGNSHQMSSVTKYAWRTCFICSQDDEAVFTNSVHIIIKHGLRGIYATLSTSRLISGKSTWVLGLKEKALWTPFAERASQKPSAGARPKPQENLIKDDYYCTAEASSTRVAMRNPRRDVGMMNKVIEKKCH